MPHLDPTGQSLVDTVRRAPAILFDFFHTLSAVEITHDVLPPETHETLRLDADAWRREWRSLALDRALGRIIDPYASIAVPARAANPAIADDLIREAVGIRLAKFEKAVREVPLDVVETLATLRAAGKRLALVSNAEAMEIVRWPGSPLDGAFDATLFSCQVGLAKPDERIFVQACGLLNVAADECLFVGDGGTDELLAAKALGMTTVHMIGIIAHLWPERIPERAPYADYVIESIPQLLSGGSSGA